MKIREHFSLALWPPAWMTITGNESPPADQSEELILREVEWFTPPHPDPHRGYIRLAAEFGRESEKTYTSRITGRTFTSTKPGKIYTGLVTVVRDPEFLEQLYEILQNSMGKTIQEIGDWEI